MLGVRGMGLPMITLTGLQCSVGVGTGSSASR